MLQSIIKQVVRNSLGAAIESISCHCGAAVSIITDTPGTGTGTGTCTVRKIRILKKIFSETKIPETHSSVQTGEYWAFPLHSDSYHGKRGRHSLKL